MLVVLPTSTCDVCLERYVWDSDAIYPQPPGAYEHLGRPHVISCGHVFCHQCLSNIRTPRTCPLCRAAFHLTRAVRIHVDLAYETPAESSNNAASSSSAGSAENDSENGGVRLTKEETEARELELKLVQVFSDTSVMASRSTSERGEDEEGRAGGNGNGGRQEANEDDEERMAEVEARRNVVLDEVRSWLESTNAAPDEHPILRALLAALPSHASLPSLTRTLNSAQAENIRIRSDRDHLRRCTRRAERAKDQEAALAKSSEKAWLARISEIERDCELKITQIETERQRLEDELGRVKLSLKEAQAAQSDILIQAQMQVREQNQQNQVPAPPYSPQPRQDESSTQPQAGASSSTEVANGTSSTSTSEGITFPRTSSPPSTSTPARGSSQAHPHTQPEPSSTYEQHNYSYDFTHSHAHNPLPRPPEPIPLSRLPAFARPLPGSSAYTVARALARHGTRREKERGRDGEERGRESGDARRERRKDKERERIVLRTVTDSEKDRRERRRRDREREREREVGTDSATSKDRHRRKEKEKGKEKEKDKGTDKGTDTSTTETQERKRARTRHASLFGTASSSSAYLYEDALPPSSSYLRGSSFAITNNANVRSKGQTNDSAAASANADPNAKTNPDPIPAVPPDVVGGWGLERSWRASYASSHSGHSGASASRENLRGDFTQSREVGAGKSKSESGSSSLGSSFTKLRVREREEGKDKGKGKEAERARGDSTTEFGEVTPARNDENRGVDFSQRPTRERERHVSFTTSSQPFPSSSTDARDREHDTTHELPPLQSTSYYYSQTGQREPERRRTLSAAPSALGLVLVPSPDGRGGYTYEYQYRYHSLGQNYPYQIHQYAAPTLPPQSTIQPPSSASTNNGTAGKESVKPLSAAQMDQARSSNMSQGPEYATLTRRATDSALAKQAQVHARAARVANRATTVNATAAAPLHVPQPRRISTTIPEPESEVSPQPQPQKQAQGRVQYPFPAGNSDVYVGRAYTDGQTSYSSNYYGHGQQQQGNVKAGNVAMNPNASISLDSALSSLSLAAPSQSAPVAGTGASGAAVGLSGHDTQTRVQTLRHRTSNSSNTSTSTGISLTGTTSKERRKQLLDALFSSDSEQHGNASSNRSSFASKNGNGEESGSGSGAGMGSGKRVSLGRALDAAAALGSTSSGEAVAASGTANVAQRPEAAAPSAQTQQQAPRGVPSRDGRPSQGLSTRPSTTLPSQTHAQYSSATTAAAATAASYPHQYTQHHQQYTSPTHAQVRHATYPVAMAQYPAQRSYAPTVAYQVVPGYGTTPGAYFAYYQAAMAHGNRR